MALIMSANGMCEAGRILHHLRNHIEDERNTILFVGYQAKHTLGRKILDGDREIRIFGRKHLRRAEVVAVPSLSAHADREGLVEFARPSAGRCGNLFLVHGEPEESEPLAARLRGEGFPNVTVATPLETVEV